MTIGESIKQLLEERKRVILPGFGNLKIKESGGSISSSAKRIDPPGLIIRFDGSFSKDDGLLATAFAEAAGLNKEETEQQVLELVDAIRFALDKGEVYPLDTTGIFRRDDEGKIHFQPDASWTLEPDQYGLGSMDLFELEDLPEDEAVPEAVSEEAPESEEIEKETVLDAEPLLELNEEEDIEAEEISTEKPAEKPAEKPVEKPTPKPVAKLVTKQSSKAHSKQVPKPAKKQSNGETKNRSGLWRIIWIVTGILIVVLVVLLLIPSEEADPTEEKDPSQQPVQTEMPETVSEGADQSLPTIENVNPDASELDPEPNPVDEQRHDFFIIAGSFRNLANASELQDKLKARGYPAEVMITENRMYRVSVATYATSAEAERDLPGFKAEPGLESSWLLSNE